MFGQLDAAPLEFQTASVKLHASGPAKSPSIEHGILTGTNVSLKSLLQFAYELQDPQISGPAWMGTERYDIVAKAESSASDAQVRLMLQQLLLERFQLKARRETKELPVYWLTVAAGGPRLRDPEEEEAFNNSYTGKSPFKPGFAAIFSNKDLPGFAERLSRGIGRLVVDKTGIQGRFWFQLEWPIENQPLGPSPALVAAVKEQLGLNLEGRQAPVEMLIIDHIEKLSDK